MFSFSKKLRKKKFGEIAVSKGLASQKEIDEALRDQEEYAKKHNIHKKIGIILTKKNILGPDDVKRILEEQKGTKGIMAWFFELFSLNK